MNKVCPWVSEKCNNKIQDDQDLYLGISNSATTYHEMTKIICTWGISYSATFIPQHELDLYLWHLKKRNPQTTRWPRSVPGASIIVQPTYYEMTKICTWGI